MCNNNDQNLSKREDLQTTESFPMEFEKRSGINKRPLDSEKMKKQILNVINKTDKK